MKIRLAIVEKDANYLSHIVSAFNMKYADQIETYSFTNLETALQILDEARIDVLVATALRSTPPRCRAAAALPIWSSRRTLSRCAGRRSSANSSVST